MTEFERWTEKSIAGLEVDFPLVESSKHIRDLAIEDALREHVMWFRKWKASFVTPDDNFRPEIVCRDDRCKMGTWIHSLTSPTTDTKQYQHLRQTHADFHLLAADIINDYNKGLRMNAFVRARSELMDASKKIANALEQLEKKMAIETT